MATVAPDILDGLDAMIAGADVDRPALFARVSGVPLDREAVWAHALEIFCAVGPHTTSMAADVLAHRRTEIDAFCGEVDRIGVQRDVPTPINRAVWQALKAIEATYDERLVESDPGQTRSSTRT